MRPHAAETVVPIMAAWFPFVFATNGVNRAMGNRDFYAIVLAPAVIAKLGFIDDLVHRCVGDNSTCATERLSRLRLTMA